MDEKISRRNCLNAFGAAGAGMFGSLASPAEAAVKRVDRAQFDYRFRTFEDSEIIRLGMIGVDGHTDMILRDLPALKNVRLAAYANRSGGAALPKEVKVYRTYEEMLDREELDIVGICLPYYQNAEAAMAAARKGLHVVMEKPVATTLADFEALKSTVVQRKVRLTALLGMRLDPPYRAIRESIGKGRIGEPVLATAQKSYKFGKSRPDFYRSKEQYGGTIPWVGIHAIDYIHHTTGLDYTRVAAFQGNRCHRDYPGVEDHAGILFELSNGGNALLNLDFLRPESAPTHGDDRLRVIGSEGVLEIGDGGKRVELIMSSGVRDITLPEAKPFFADFVAELRGEGEHILSPEEPFEMTRVSLLARDSAEQKRIFDL
ncbi:MAG: Gfo/Idh/MocA family protein [Candidatus Latescibacterota bacterium]